MPRCSPTCIQVIREQSTRASNAWDCSLECMGLQPQRRAFIGRAPGGGRRRRPSCAAAARRAPGPARRVVVRWSQCLLGRSAERHEYRCEASVARACSLRTACSPARQAAWRAPRRGSSAPTARAAPHPPPLLPPLRLRRPHRRLRRRLRRRRRRWPTFGAAARDWRRVQQARWAGAGRSVASRAAARAPGQGWA